MSDQHESVDRRRFLGGAALAGGALLAGCATPSAGKRAVAGAVTKADKAGAKTGQSVAGAAGSKPQIASYRTLGRTGFRVSEVSLGCGRISDPNLVRYAYDHGVNFFDTAEVYGNGDSERMIGQAMPHLARDKVFIVTKLKIKAGDTEQTLLDRFGKCLARMKTSYADALYMHSVTDVAQVKHAAFHAAVKRLKADGKLRHAGISSHGPRGKKGDSMEKVLLAAVADGRFDLMLLVYNFLASASGARVLAAAKAKNLGTALMKTSPARLKPPVYDPDDPADEHERLLSLLRKRGLSPAQAVAKLNKRLAGKRKLLLKHKAAIDAFVKKHGVASEALLRQKSVLWALQNGDFSTCCVSMNDFEALAAFIPLAGQKLARADAALLRDWALANSGAYCRHGCTACAGSCPHDVAVSTIMRYAYYAEQGQQAHAMRAFAAYGAQGAAPSERCLDCDAPCEAACPHDLAVQAQLLSAEGRLVLA
jgi:predicted aldo/keto reductase-like oxidoreductase